MLCLSAVSQTLKLCSIGLLQRTSVTLVVAAGGHPSSLKITAYEQLNFSKVGSFSGKKKTTSTSCCG